jgi:hypothetical protein
MISLFMECAYRFLLTTGRFTRFIRVESHKRGAVKQKKGVDNVFQDRTELVIIKAVKAQETDTIILFHHKVRNG